MQQLAKIRVFLGQRCIAVGQRGGSADFDVVFSHLNALHCFDMANVDHHRQFALELGDFQGQVGAACEQARLRVGGVEIGQISDR